MFLPLQWMILCKHCGYEGGITPHVVSCTIIIIINIWFTPIYYTCVIFSFLFFSLDIADLWLGVLIVLVKGRSQKDPPPFKKCTFVIVIVIVLYGIHD